MTHSPEPWIEGEWRINEEARGGKNPCKRSWIFTAGSGIHSGVQRGDIIEDVLPPPTEIIRQLDCEEGGGYEISDDDMERIVACVNAMVGIERPVEFMKQLGRVMMRSGGVCVMRDLPMGMIGFVEELEKLKEIQSFEEFC